MNYPVLIENEPHLCRLIRQIAREVKKELPVKESPYMSKQDCYREIGRRITDELISTGKLKVTTIQGRVRIRRSDFNNSIKLKP